MPVSETTSTVAISKTAWYFGAVAIFNYLNIPTEQMGILATLMLIDFVTGVGKQFRIDRSEIKSHLAWLWAMKKIATLMAVLSIGLILKGLHIDDHRYVITVISVFIMAEGYSTLQNIYAIRTGKILPEFDVISLFIKHLWEFFKNRIEEMVKKTVENSTSQIGQTDETNKS